MARLAADAGLIVLAAFISPFRADRQIVREILPEGKFVEVYVDASLEVCQQRDLRGLYEKALRGEIKKFTGIDSPYEAPQNPEIHILADRDSVAEAVNQLLAYLDSSGALKSGYQPVKISA